VDGGNLPQILKQDHSTATPGRLSPPASGGKESAGVKIYSHQAAALDEIVARCRAFYGGAWSDLPIKPRFASLLCGPTGPGKTALAAMAAEAVNAKMVRVSAPAWMPCGAHNRGVAETVSTLAAAISANDRTLLVIDEIDKIGYHGDNAWLGYIRGEIFDLTDRKWPNGLKSPDEASDDDDTAPVSESKWRELLTTKLATTVFILGIGTFQEYFDSVSNRRAIGFGATDPADEELSAEIVAEKLPRELANRFNSSLICLPELRPEHYRLIANEATETLPLRMQAAFREAVARRITGAISAKKGMRFLEEAMLDVLKTLPPAPSTAPKPDLHFDLCTL